MSTSSLKSGMLVFHGIKVKKEARQDNGANQTENEFCLCHIRNDPSFSQQREGEAN